MALTNRDKAWAIRADLNEKGYADERILNELLSNILSGDESIRAMDLVAEELGEVEEYTEDEDEDNPNTFPNNGMIFHFPKGPDLFQQMGLTNEQTGLKWETRTI